MLDAWTRLRKRSKAGVSFAYMLLLIYRYLYGRYIKKWGRTTWCMPERTDLCVEPKWLYCGALMNCIVFQSKFVLSYIQGYDFAILNAAYIYKSDMRGCESSASEGPHQCSNHSSDKRSSCNSRRQPDVCTCGEQHTACQQAGAPSCRDDHDTTFPPHTLSVKTAEYELQAGPLHALSFSSVEPDRHDSCAVSSTLSSFDMRCDLTPHTQFRRCGAIHGSRCPAVLQSGRLDFQYGHSETRDFPQLSHEVLAVNRARHKWLDKE